MFEPKVKLNRALYEKLARAASAAGYSSAEELIVHVLERAVADLEGEVSEEEVRRRLKGLGYLG